MAVYEGYKCYGPYKRKDNRYHVILINRNSQDRPRITVSYPKYLVECYIDRYLAHNETVDHIDGNFANNRLSNLRIVDRALHVKSHIIHRMQVTKRYIICNKEFVTNDNRRITCGARHCMGMSAHVKHDKRNDTASEVNKYSTCRSLIGEILSVEDANSGNSLVENPEQG